MVRWCWLIRILELGYATGSAIAKALNIVNGLSSFTLWR